MSDSRMKCEVSYAETREKNVDSIPDLVARVQAIEARLDSIEGGQMVTDCHSDLVKIATILGKRGDETIEYAARRVVRLLEGAEDAFNRVQAERNAAVMERDEAVRTLHRMLGTEYGTRLVSPGDRTSVHDALRFLTRLGLAEEYEDGTFTLLETKP